MYPVLQQGGIRARKGAIPGGATQRSLASSSSLISISRRISESVFATVLPPPAAPSPPSPLLFPFACSYTTFTHHTYEGVLCILHGHVRGVSIGTLPGVECPDRTSGLNRSEFLDPVKINVAQAFLWKTIENWLGRIWCLLILKKLSLRFLKIL